MKDYYRILKVEPTASREEIRAAFRQLARTYHPDVNVTADTTHFIEIRQAYETLMETTARARYDKRREAFMGAHPAKKTKPTPVSKGVTRTPFGQKTATSPGFKPLQFKATLLRQPRDPNPLDRVLRVTLPLEESLASKTAKIRIPESKAPFKTEISWRIQLPGKLYPDAVLIVPGLGRQTAALGERGDLILKVNFAPHPKFRLINGQLHANAEVMPWQAALGGRVKVPTLEEEMDILLTPNRQLPYMHCLKGMGLYQKDGNRGDLWYNLRLKIPQPPTWRARRLWAELAEEYRHAHKGNTPPPFSR